jgi:hypothetical protein
MRVAGSYCDEVKLSLDWPNGNQVVDDGDVPSFRLELRFVLKTGRLETRRIWALADTGAKSILVPGDYVGVTDMGAGGLMIAGRSIAGRSNYVPCSTCGVGGVSNSIELSAYVGIEGYRLSERFRVRTSNHIPYPLVGRDVLNEFVALFNPSQEVILSNNGRGRLLGRLFRCIG